MNHSIEIDIAISEDAWNSAFPALELITRDTVLKALHMADIHHDTEISLSYVNDGEIQILNRDYRGKDKPTNVLSFPQNEPAMLGDIVLAYETVVREAKEQEKPLENHLRHLLVHGVLHLLGHDHEEDGEAEAMESLEARILSEMGIKNPYETA